MYSAGTASRSHEKWGFIIASFCSHVLGCHIGKKHNSHGESQTLNMYLGNWCYHQLVNSSLGVINFLLHKARINHIIYSINSQRCLCNVGGNNNLQITV